MRKQKIWYLRGDSKATEAAQKAVKVALADNMEVVNTFSIGPHDYIVLQLSPLYLAMQAEQGIRQPSLLMQALDHLLQ